MKKIISNLSLILPGFMIVGCYHDAPDKPVPKIEYPLLSAQAGFNEIQTLDSIELTTYNGKLLFARIIPRLLSVVETTNQEADIVSVSAVRENPVFKPSSRSFNIVSASNKRCDNIDGSMKNTESLIWEDVNKDGKPLLGDKWYYILENCANQANGSSITGLFVFSGMSDPFNELGLSGGEQDQEFSDYTYQFDMQVSHKNNTLVYLQNAGFTYARELDENDNEITTLEIKADSLLGGESAPEHFLFNVSSATFNTNSDEEILSFSFESIYYDAVDEIDGFVNIKTIEPIVISYTQIGKEITDVELISGKLRLLDDQGKMAVLTVTEDQQDALIEWDLDAEEGIDSQETVDKYEFINNGSLILLMLTG